MVGFSKLLNKRQVRALSLSLSLSLSLPPLAAESTFSFIMMLLKPQGKLDGFTVLSTETDDRT